MKKKTFFIIVIIMVFMLLMTTSSCTENYIARELGGTLKIEVEPGYKVTSATWKDDDLFYFMEPMEKDYSPKEKKFVESSSYGILESTVIFKESKK